MVTVRSKKMPITVCSHNSKINHLIHGQRGFKFCSIACQKPNVFHVPNDSDSYVMMELTVGNFKRFSNSNVFVN